jgi:GNAT superfamily N-acetyltransferase
MTYEITLKDTPTFNELTIDRALTRHNATFGLAPSVELTAVLHDDAGAVRGGVQGEVEWGWLYVDLLWVDQTWRGRGYGRQLMHAIEQKAYQMGCERSWLATTSFQSLPFYYHYGYRLVGKIEDRPPGYNYYFLHRAITPGTSPAIEVTDDPDPEAVTAVRRGLAAYNRGRGVRSDGRRAAAFLLDRQDDVYGGVIAATYWGWLDIQAMWVNETLRGDGYGTRLLATAEATAAKRGCRHAFIDVSSFQNLDFFIAQGYATFATLPERPPGYQTHFMRKPLESATG